MFTYWSLVLMFWNVKNDKFTVTSLTYYVTIMIFRIVIELVMIKI